MKCNVTVFLQQVYIETLCFLFWAKEDEQRFANTETVCNSAFVRYWLKCACSPRVIRIKSAPVMRHVNCDDFSKLIKSKKREYNCSMTEKYSNYYLGLAPTYKIQKIFHKQQSKDWVNRILLFISCQYYDKSKHKSSNSERSHRNVIKVNVWIISHKCYNTTTKTSFIIINRYQNQSTVVDEC